jgi:hypothetical protein
MFEIDPTLLPAALMVLVAAIIVQFLIFINEGEMWFYYPDLIEGKFKEIKIRFRRYYKIHGGTP